MSGSMKDLLGDEFYADRQSLPLHLRGLVPLPAYQSHSSTSREAAHSIAPRVTDLQRRVLDFIVEHHGATDEQIIDAMAPLKESTVRPRRIELVKKLKLIKDNGRYALTRSGRRATLWEAA